LQLKRQAACLKLVQILLDGNGKRRRMIRRTDNIPCRKPNKNSTAFFAREIFQVSENFSNTGLIFRRVGGLFPPPLFHYLNQ